MLVLAPTVCWKQTEGHVGPLILVSPDLVQGGSTWQHHHSWSRRHLALNGLGAQMTLNRWDSALVFLVGN